MSGSDAKREWEGLKREWRMSWRVIGTTLTVLWGLELLDLAVLGGALDRLGIRPREAGGLVGVVAHPFLHGGLGHLIGNTVGIVMLGWLVLARDLRVWLAVTVGGTLLGGLAVWLFGRGGTLHVGASGVIFAYFGYLLSCGFFERRLGSILLSLAVFLAYGGMIFGVLPGQRGISWEGHLFGFLAGVVMAKVLSKRAPNPT